ncbi:hypothetical protein LCGC14_2296260 [marine sediment metagenome]|uniref:Uncharacterized protein n=1 Tax=marine sediment metagenome TaxID=412755 RepID=A0A0F9DCD3_9ZZZZ
MSVRAELLEGSRAPVLVIDREQMKVFTRLVHTFASRSTKHNLQKMMEAGSFLGDLGEASEEEMERFDLEVAHVEASREAVEAVTQGSVGKYVDKESTSAASGEAQNSGEAQE